MHEYHYIRYHFVRRSDCTYISFYGPVFLLWWIIRILIIQSLCFSYQLIRQHEILEGGNNAYVFFRQQFQKYGRNWWTMNTCTVTCTAPGTVYKMKLFLQVHRLEYRHGLNLFTKATGLGIYLVLRLEFPK